MEWILIIIFFYIAVGIFSWGKETISNSKNYVELKPKFDNLETAKKEHEAKVEKDREDWKVKVEQWNEKLKNDKESLEIIAKQKSMGFPWLAEAYADYFSLVDLVRQKYLENKKHPALTSAEIVKNIKKEKRELLARNKIISYKINYFEKLFPWLLDLIAENENEIIPVRIDDGNLDEDKNDRVRDYLTPEEYNKLPSVDRNQKALDRYLVNRNKSNWALGRDYEMYVGYLYEKQGYSVEYSGIIDGFDDLGRDVIATKGNEVCIVQCKRWASWKEMREKHIFQLFGTTMEYWIKNFKNNSKPKSFEEFAKFLTENKLRPVFFTSTNLSDKAREMADTLSVEVVENQPIGDFPRIKCNISTKDGEKIYHLPFDQQYDRTIIGDHAGEFHAFTVKEAEDAGFRRAFKHRF